MVRAYVCLVVAIALEVVGTLSLRQSDGFREPAWTAAVVLGYSISIVVFAQALRAGLGLGVAYATLTASGLVAAAVISAAVFDEQVTGIEGLGLLCLAGGVVLLQSRAPDEGVPS